MDFYYIRGPWINSVPCTGTPCREVHRKGLCAPKFYIPNTIKTDFIVWQQQLIVDFMPILTQKVHFLNWQFSSILCHYQHFSMDTTIR